jgi:hypothetical protein
MRSQYIKSLESLRDSSIIVMVSGMYEDVLEPLARHLEAPEGQPADASAPRHHRHTTALETRRSWWMSADISLHLPSLREYKKEPKIASAPMQTDGSAWDGA